MPFDSIPQVTPADVLALFARAERRLMGGGA